MGAALRHRDEAGERSQSRMRVFGGLSIDLLEKCDAIENTQVHSKPGTDIIPQSLEYDVQVDLKHDRCRGDESKEKRGNRRGIRNKA